MKKKKFTISVFTEDVVGILNRVSIIITRRKINVESIAASESEIKGIHRYTIVLSETEDQVKELKSGWSIRKTSRSDKSSCSS